MLLRPLQLSQDIFPTVVISSCVNHVARNLRKALERIKKIRGFAANEKEALKNSHGHLGIVWVGTILYSLFACYLSVHFILFTTYVSFLWKDMLPGCHCPRQHSKGCGCLSDDIINHHVFASFWVLVKTHGKNPAVFRERSVDVAGLFPYIVISNQSYKI